MLLDFALSETIQRYYSNSTEGKELVSLLHSCGSLIAALPVPIPPSGTADLMPRGGGVPLEDW